MRRHVLFIFVLVMEAVGIAILPLELLIVASIFFGTWSAKLYWPEIKYFVWHTVLRRPVPPVRITGHGETEASMTSSLTVTKAKQPTKCDRLRAILSRYEVLMHWDEEDHPFDEYVRGGWWRQKKFPKTVRDKITGEIKEIPHPSGHHWSNRKH